MNARANCPENLESQEILTRRADVANQGFVRSRTQRVFSGPNWTARQTLSGRRHPVTPWSFGSRVNPIYIVAWMAF